MSYKGEFLVIVLVIIFGWLGVSAIADMTKRGVLILVSVVGAACLLYLLHLSPVGQPVERCLQTGRTPYVASAALLLIVISFSLLLAALSRRRYNRMDWPETMSQLAMEQHGVSYLRRRGWQVTEETNYGASRVYRCRKDELRAMIAFAKDHLDFDSFRRIMKRNQVDLSSTVVACYRKPTLTLQDVALISGTSVIFYKDLKVMDTVALTLKNRNAADRTALRDQHAKAES